MERRAREVHIQQALMWRKGKGSTGPRPGQLLPHLAPHQLLALPQAPLPPAPPPPIPTSMQLPPLSPSPELASPSLLAFTSNSCSLSIRT